MKFRLDIQHYRDDKLIEPGTVVGDDCEITWRDAKGHPYPPSSAMTPLDAEAKKLIEDTFQTSKPERDPTKAIPLQGTFDPVKVHPPGVPRPGSSPQAQHSDLVKSATPPVHNPPSKPTPTEISGPKPTNEGLKDPEPPSKK